MPSGTFALLPSCSSSVPQSAANSKWSFQLSPKRLRRQRATVSNETGSQVGRSALRSLVKGSCELFRSCIKLFFVVARTEVVDLALIGIYRSGILIKIHLTTQTDRTSIR